MNQNFLSNASYKFVNKKFEGVEFFVATADLPTMDVDASPLANRFSTIKFPGDKIVYSDLTLSFRVDSEMSNYILLSNWLKDLEKADHSNTNDLFSDSKLLIYNYANVHFLTFSFKDSFPTSLGGISFTVENTEEEFVTTEATFAFTEYTIENV
jgi:hypothetical protein